jgi:hypothetical protein
VKRGKSAYMFFAAEQQKTFDKSTPVPARGTVIGERWRALSAADKAPYEKLAAADKARAESERAALKNGGARRCRRRREEEKSGRQKAR